MTIRPNKPINQDPQDPNSLNYYDAELGDEHFKLVTELPDDTLVKVTFKNMKGFSLTVEGELQATEWNERFIRYENEFDQDAVYSSDSSDRGALIFDISTRHSINPFITNIEVITTPEPEHYHTHGD